MKTQEEGGAMIPYERQMQLLQLLEENDFMSTEQLVNALEGVSESTVRRDLKALSDDGQIVLMRGGASKVRGNSHDTPVDSKLILNTEAKERIARCAADLVQDGEVIYIDAGTTPLKMARYLRDKKITIVTTNVLIFQELAGAKAECIIIGGSVNVDMGSVMGDLTVSTLENMFFDRAFLGITGFSSKAGFSTPDFKESRKKQVVKQNSRHTYILVDSSKVGVTTMCKVFKLDEVEVITEKETELLKECGDYLIAR